MNAPNKRQSKPERNALIMQRLREGKHPRDIAIEFCVTEPRIYQIRKREHALALAFHVEPA